MGGDDAHCIRLTVARCGNAADYAGSGGLVSHHKVREVEPRYIEGLVGRPDDDERQLCIGRKARERDEGAAPQGEVCVYLVDDKGDTLPLGED